MAEKKDSWDKLKVLTGASIPIVLAVIGAFINSSIKSREVDFRYVELAAKILVDNPPDTTGTKHGITDYRSWAVDVISALSPIKIPDSVKVSITRGDVEPPVPTEVASSLGAIGFGGNLLILPKDDDEMGSAWVAGVFAGSRNLVAMVFGNSELAEDVVKRVSDLADRPWRQAVWVQTAVDLQRVLPKDRLPPGIEGERVVFFNFDGFVSTVHRLDEMNSFGIERAYAVAASRSP